MTDPREIFDYYLSKGLTKYRRFQTWEPKIRGRLKSYSAADLKTCIDKLAASDWHRDNGYQGLEQIVGSDLRVEKWLARKATRSDIYQQPGAFDDFQPDAVVGEE